MNHSINEAPQTGQYENLKWRKLGNESINDVVPGVRGQRAFPTQQINYADPFVLLDHIGLQKMPDDYYMDGHMHPHRGFETITIMLAGNLLHKDNFNGRALLTTGGVQQMNAGRGISHGGDIWADEKTGELNEVQLWVNSPAAEKMSEPSVNNFSASQIPIIEKEHLKLRIIAGTQLDQYGSIIKGPVNTFANICVFHGLESSSLNFSTININPGHDRILIYLLKGSLDVHFSDKSANKTETLNEHESLLIENNSLQARNLTQLSISNMTGEFLFLSGQSINQDIVMGGPFVMNTMEQIKQAKIDYANGYFD